MQFLQGGPATPADGIGTGQHLSRLHLVYFDVLLLLQGSLVVLKRVIAPDLDALHSVLLQFVIEPAVDNAVPHLFLGLDLLIPKSVCLEGGVAVELFQVILGILLGDGAVLLHVHGVDVLQSEGLADGAGELSLHI